MVDTARPEGASTAAEDAALDEPDRKHVLDGAGLRRAISSATGTVHASALVGGRADVLRAGRQTGRGARLHRSGGATIGASRTAEEFPAA